MKNYMDIVYEVYSTGIECEDRTGVGVRKTFGLTFHHDMSFGFPLLSLKKTPMRVIAVELEGFVKGVTKKNWFQERNCHIWDEWCSPDALPRPNHLTGEDRKFFQARENDLGPIYGSQWRNFNGQGVDQLMNAVEGLKKDPNSRRHVVTAWNPLQLDSMALPPCHMTFTLSHNGIGGLDLAWVQRSVDVMLGLPFNIASYGLLLELIAKEVGLKPARLVGQLQDVHIYKNHFAGMHELLGRKWDGLFPQLELPEYGSILNWDHTKLKLHNYNPQPYIPFKVAV